VCIAWRVYGGVLAFFVSMGGVEWWGLLCVVCCDVVEIVMSRLDF